MGEIDLRFLLIFQVKRAYKSGLLICLRAPALFVSRAGLPPQPISVMQTNDAGRAVIRATDQFLPELRIFSIF